VTEDGSLKQEARSKKQEVRSSLIRLLQQHPLVPRERGFAEKLRTED